MGMYLYEDTPWRTNQEKCPLSPLPFCFISRGGINCIAVDFLRFPLLLVRASLVDQLNLRSRLAGGAEQSELHRANIIGPVPPVAAETRELWENYGPLGPLKIENSSRF